VPEKEIKKTPGKMSMSKKKRIIWVVVVAVLLVLVIYLTPRIMVCNSYHKMISRPLALETLSIKPQQVILPQPNNSCVFSLGFAEMPLCPNSIRTIRYNKGLGVSCRDDSNSITYLFALPRNPSEITYDLQLKMANTRPINYSEIFFSNIDEVVCRIRSAYIFKVSNVLNQNGIGIFETERIKGLIRFGRKKYPDEIEAEIFSKDGKVTQDILVISESPQKSKEAMFSLLSSYWITIPQADVNDSNYLDKLIMGQLSGNSKLEIVDANK
jgi:hypothetical protein